MRLEFRELQEQNSEQSRRQSILAFASSGEDPSLRGNVALFGLFDGETLAAQSLLLQMDSFFGGAPCQQPESAMLPLRPSIGVTDQPAGSWSRRSTKLGVEEPCYQRFSVGQHGPNGLRIDLMSN